MIDFSEGLNKLLTSLFGTSYSRGGLGMETQQWSEGGLFNRGGFLGPPALVNPLSDYIGQAFSSSSGEAPNPTPTTLPTQAPQQAPTQMPTPQPTPTIPQWNDKPTYPEALWTPTQTAGNQYGIDPAVLASLAAQEVGGYNYEPRVGGSGERGITQIQPQFFAQQAGYENPEEYGRALETDSSYALMEAARILSDLIKRFPEIGDALAGYNAGPSNIQAGQGYSREVLGRIGR